MNIEQCYDRVQRNYEGILDLIRSTSMSAKEMNDKEGFDHAN